MVTPMSERLSKWFIWRSFAPKKGRTGDKNLFHGKYLNINCLELLEEVREGGEATEAGQGEGRCIYRKRYRGIWI